MVAVPPDRIPVTAEEGRWVAAVAALERTGNARAARTGYRAMLERWPNNPNGAIGLANTHYALGELPDAERVLREAAKRNPESVVVLNNWAMTLSDLGRNDEALPVIERAATLGGPFSGAVQKTRETILGRQGSRVERVQ
jgi:Tfp pilus assembly protein PilF